MIVLVLGNIAGSRKMLALVRDCIAALDAPAAYIDPDGLRFDPVSAMRLETAEGVLSRVDRLVSLLWEDGARRLVIAVPAPGPGQPAVDLARLAFWARRGAKQHVYTMDVKAHLRERTMGTWSPDVLETTVRQLAKTLGPRQEVRAWEPAPPRHQTERLELTWPSAAQVEGYYRSIAGTDVFDTLIWNGPASADDLHDYWLSRKQEAARAGGGTCGREANFAIIEKGSGEMIGACSLRPKDIRGQSHGVCDIGYLIARPWHGRGYATEMVKELVEIAFAERGAERVYADVFTGNQASRRVLEKCGFEFEGTGRSAVAKPNGRRDEWRMGITRASWTAGGGASRAQQAVK